VATFHVFRVRVERPSQLHLMDGGQHPPDLILQALHEHPSFVTGWGHTWHIGNLEPIERNGYYFKIGRSARSIVPIWDDKHRVFFDAEAPTAPYTHVLLDLTYQVCGIAQNRDLAPNVESIGRRLEAILNHSRLAREVGCKFVVSRLLNPEGFLAQIRSAYAIQQFSFTFSKPNHFDQDEFSRGLEDFLQYIDGSTGRIRVRGENLDVSVIESQTSAALASGQQVSARIKPTRESKPKHIKIEDNPLTVVGHNVDDAEEKRSLIRRIVERYQELRGRVSA